MEDEISKSQLKRQAHARHELGVKIVQLSRRCVDNLPLPITLREAIVAAQKNHQRIAKKRDLQLIGKLMRNLSEEDWEAILRAYQVMMQAADVHSPRFKQIERWRERLIDEDKSALTAFLNEHNCDDRQRRQVLIRQAKAERAHQKHPGASTRLFRFLRECIS